MVSYFAWDSDEMTGDLLDATNGFIVEPVRGAQPWHRPMDARPDAGIMGEWTGRCDTGRSPSSAGLW
jgi:hypothetical protein